MKSVVALIIARNESTIIALTIASLLTQTHLPYEIVVIDDGSTDGTGDIARAAGCIVVRTPPHEESYVGRPELAQVWNAGFSYLAQTKPDFLLLSGADHIYPPNYVKRLLEVMVDTDIVMASGVIQGQPIGNQPRGSGRIINGGYFRQIMNMCYPITAGWESYPIYKALSLGLEVQVIKDLVTMSRTLTRSPRKSLGLGKAMRALGYYWPYALGRSLLLFLRKPQSGINMLVGFISHRETLDCADYVRAMQRYRLPRRILQIDINRTNPT